MRKLSEFKDTAAPLMQGQIGGAAALHRGGGARSQVNIEPISVSAAMENARGGAFSVKQPGATGESSGNKSTDVFGKKTNNVSKKLKIEYGSTLKNISQSGVKINKGNFESKTPGVKTASALNLARFGGGNPMSALNVASIQPAVRPALPPKPTAPPASMALRAARTTSASKVPMAQPASTTLPQIGGPVSS